jgi:hypothetical protein
MDTVVLVEGMSDVAAITTLARRLGHDFEADGVRVVDIGGATNIRRAVAEWRARRFVVLGLCDEGEARIYARAFDDPADFFVCVADLEDELIRALGPDGAEAMIASEGELESFRRFQNQPAQRERPIAAQLRRFVGTRAGRKVRYGTSLVAALELDRVPQPLRDLVAAAAERSID